MRSRLAQPWRLIRVVLVLALVGPLALVGRAEARQEFTHPLDAALITVRPADLEALGWVHQGAFVHALEDQTRDHADYLGRGTTAEDVAAVLAPLGWQHQYVSMLTRPSQADPTLPEQRIRSYVTEYADAAGASAGFAYLEDEQTVVSATDLPLDRPIGDEAELTSERGTGNVDGRLVRSLDLTFRLGSVVAGITLIQYPTADRVDPDLELVHQLAAMMAERLTYSSPVGMPGQAVVRLHDDQHEIVTFDDAYYRLDGVDVPLADETGETARLRTSTYASAEHVYQLWQGIDTGTDAGALYGVTLLHFPDSGAAEHWIADLPDLLGRHPFYGDIAIVPTNASLGEQHLGLSYVPNGGGAAAPHALLLAVRVGNAVARVHLVPQGTLEAVPLDAVVALTELQMACLEDGACSTAIPVPDVLDDVLRPAPATPVAEVVEPPEPMLH